MRLRKLVLALVCALLAGGAGAWAWETYSEVQNNRAVRSACEGVPSGVGLEEAVSKFTPLGENKVRFEGPIAVVRVIGPAACRCKMIVENGRVQSTFALCEH